MTYLPRLTRVDIDGYEMYPGTADARGLHRDFDPGVTLVVGANGLGKTTLVTLLRHLCAGPARLSNRSSGAFEAGRLRATPIDVDTFADRVGDRAVDATARLVMDVGPRSVDVTRSMRNLELLNLTVDGVEAPAEELEFRTVVTTAAQVAEYADWLLLIDYLVFVAEDRSQPFWDRNVQRHLLRILIPDRSIAQAQAAAESYHISADSEFRNARAQLNRHKRRLDELISSAGDVGDVNQTLLRLGDERDAVNARVLELEEAHDVAVKKRDDAVREHEVAELEHQMAVEALEAARFALIEASLPTQDEVLRYLSARMATDGLCPVCGQRGGTPIIHSAADSCFLCGLHLDDQTPAATVDVAGLENAVQRTEAAVSANGDRLSERTRAVRELEVSLASEKSTRADLTERIKALRARLPSGENDVDSAAALVADLEDDLARLRSDLDSSRDALDGIIAESNAAIRARQDDIKRVFDRVATMFLVEPCHLVPHETSIRIGQEGARFSVQAFDLDLGSSTEVGESRRDAADDVSESQRVFIDIAFRIALVHSCIELGLGSMVVDAPEGSLDAVFSSNAAALLGAFLELPNSEGRLVLATNLVEGSLLPELARRAGVASESDPRLINLLDLAAPTAAVTRRRDEYRTVLTDALLEAQQPRRNP